MNELVMKACKIVTILLMYKCINKMNTIIK